jgi:hypothetical protein
LLFYGIWHVYCVYHENNYRISTDKRTHFSNFAGIIVYPYDMADVCSIFPIARKPNGKEISSEEIFFLYSVHPKYVDA